MRDTTIARSYAEALYDLGEQHGQQAEFETAAGELYALLRAEPRIRTFMDVPSIQLQEKERVLRRALDGRVPPLFMNFVLVVVRNGRQRLLPDILREYHTLLDERLGRLHVQVTLAQEPDERLEEEITADLSRLLGRNAIPHVRVDPAILGGIIVRYGDRVLDGSLRRRVAALRRNLLMAGIPPSR